MSAPGEIKFTGGNCNDQFKAIRSQFEDGIQEERPCHRKLSDLRLNYFALSYLRVLVLGRKHSNIAKQPRGPRETGGTTAVVSATVSRGNE